MNLTKHDKQECFQQCGLTAVFDDSFKLEEKNLCEKTDGLSFVDGVDELRDGYWRRVSDDCVTFQPDYLYYESRVKKWDFVVRKFAFVPGYHLCEIVGTHDHDSVKVHSSHGTLAEAMSICKVLLVNGGIHYM